MSKFNFCPNCAAALAERQVNHRRLSACPNCTFIDWRNAKPCAGALVLRDGKVLLVKRGIEPFKGCWDIPGGFLESHETPEQAAIRELREETGLAITDLNYLIAVPDARSLANERKLQEALDAGAGPGHIRLVWTSHTDPETLAANPDTDKRGVIHWWSANAGGCNPGFLRPQIEKGDIVWFYHNGGVSCGVHCVNASGIELRTWGDICWRYKINGSFWWAMDSGDRQHPMTRPIYKDADNRWGNGVLFYSGARLPDVGLPAIDGPVSCLRMKAYRRGLQDYEYCWLLKQAGKEKVADDLVRAVIPKALVEAGKKMTREEGEASAKGEAAGGARAAADGSDGTPFWSRDVNVWYQMRVDLAKALDAR